MAGGEVSTMAPAWCWHRTARTSQPCASTHVRRSHSEQGGVSGPTDGVRPDHALLPASALLVTQRHRTRVVWWAAASRKQDPAGRTRPAACSRGARYGATGRPRVTLVACKSPRGCLPTRGAAATARIPTSDHYPVCLFEAPFFRGACWAGKTGNVRRRATRGEGNIHALAGAVLGWRLFAPTLRLTGPANALNEQMVRGDSAMREFPARQTG